MSRVRASIFILSSAPVICFFLLVAIGAFQVRQTRTLLTGIWLDTPAAVAITIGAMVAVFAAIYLAAGGITARIRKERRELVYQLESMLRQGVAPDDTALQAWPELQDLGEDVTRIRGASTRATAEKHQLENRVRNLQDQLKQSMLERSDETAQKGSRDVLDAVPKAIYGVSLDGICIFCNSTCVNLLGYTDESQIVGKRIDEITPINDWSTYGVATPNDPIHVPETTFWRTDGTLFPVEYWALPLQKGGDIVGAVVTFADITERKRAEMALSQEKEHAHVTLQSIGDAVITTDANQRIRYLNPVAEDLLEIATVEAKGRPFSEVFRIIDESNDSAVHDPIKMMLSASGARGSHSSAMRLDVGRQQRYIEPSASEIRDRENHTIGLIVVFRDVSEARQMARKFEYQAAHDALTGLVNRREFEHRLELMLTRNRIERMGCAILYVDLDQFKLVNDTCGHTAGDELLRQLGQMLRKHVRGRDTLARLGGDEFGVLLEGCPLGQAVQLADGMRRSIEEFRFAWEGKTFSLGASIGLVLAETAGNRLTDVLAAADTACYAAKEGGRNRIQVYHPNDEELQKHHDEMRWVGRINHALESGRLRLFSQEIVPVSQDARSRACRHTEILVRMLNPDGSLSLPGAFLPAAERYNLINATDRWVVSETVRWMKKQGDADTRFSINLSGTTLSDSRFLDFVEELLGKTQVDARRICFEITETAAIANLSRAAGHMTELKKLGFEFALDDFGSGLSSFGYLKSLPVDYLKIDGSFVKDIVEDPIDRAMVKSINEIGHIMGKRTIAEYVENEAVLRVLERIGVDYAQGYGISKPKPLETSAPAVQLAVS